MAKTKKIIILPKGTAVYPHLSSPDTHGPFANGKYKTKISVDKTAAAHVTQEISDYAKANGVAKLPFKDDPEDASKVLFNVSSKFQPVIFAADGKTKIEAVEDLRIASGSVIRVACELFLYTGGVSLQMKQVQVIDLVTYDSGMFDADEEGSFDGGEFTSVASNEESEGFAADGPDI